MKGGDCMSDINWDGGFTIMHVPEGFYACASQNAWMGICFVGWAVKGMGVGCSYNSSVTQMTSQSNKCANPAY